jgi:DNA (cytosine-5)-methyltransferase 1
MGPKREASYIDVFAGCGGLSLGLCNAGWQGLIALEKSAMAFETLSHNLIERGTHFCWPDWLPRREHDINEVLCSYADKLKSLQGTVDLVAGGPPCQGFSVAGRRRETDKRNSLIHSYIDFVRLVRPNTVFFENVKGFTMGFRNGDKTGDPYSDFVLKALKELGYRDATGKVIDFAAFGVPQRRGRFILVGSLDGSAKHFFSTLEKNRVRFLAEKGLKTRIGVLAAISDIERVHGEVDSPDSGGYKAGVYSYARNNYQRSLRGESSRPDTPDSHRFVNHTKSAIAIFRKLLKSATRDVKLSGEDRAHFGLKKRNTVVLGRTAPTPTLMSIPDDYVHYSEPRILTVREYARVQSFPDWFEFKGAYTTGGKRRACQVPRYTQIANAIPPLFAEQVGATLRELLDGSAS